MSSGTLADVDGRAGLLEWYRPRRRAYPWRVRPDPYRVLVSEVMLQQTQASRVEPAYGLFLDRFPNPDALAHEPLAEVLRAWGSLGFNRRAAALWKSARIIVERHGGRVPRRPGELLELPGVGACTAAAVASIAYGTPVAAVDTNVRRVVARAVLGAEAGEVPEDRVAEAAQAWLDRERPGEWNQAVMDLGREVCRPAPRCPACPLAQTCRYRRSGPPGPVGRSPFRRRQSPFHSSFRRVRGRVVAVLRERPSASLATLSRLTGEPLERVSAAAGALGREGLVGRGPAARAGRPGGRVWLAGDRDAGGPAR